MSSCTELHTEPRTVLFVCSICTIVGSVAVPFYVVTFFVVALEHTIWTAWSWKKVSWNVKVCRCVKRGVQNKTVGDQGQTQ